MHVNSATWGKGLRGALACLGIGLLAALPCPAELELSLTIKGSASEIAGVLELLKAAGLAGGGGMKVQMDSTFARPEAAPDAPAAPAAPTAPPPPPMPALTNPIAAPAVVAPGKVALVSVDVVDPGRKIDTIAVVLGDKVVAADLQDNGMNGDVGAGDGRWTTLLNIPASAADGNYTVTFQAFDAQGKPVTVPGPDGKPVPVTLLSALSVRH